MADSPRRGRYPTVRHPPRERIEKLAAELGLTLNETELDDYATMLQGALTDVKRVMNLDSPRFRIHERTHTNRPSGYRPSTDEDPLNVWIRKCRVDGSPSGPLAGTTVGLKDSIALAGYEMTCGSRVLEGYVPQVDATVVTRLLDAGATITGKLNMEAFAWSGSSDISDYGSVPNPHDQDFLAGGSSSGSAAAVATGDCDIALGGDQGGSIRIPAAWCGVVGLKPTWGLVPYTGIFPLDPTIDHVGPIARTVEGTARALEVLAGEDIQDGVRMDDRQPRGVTGEAYTETVEKDVDDVTLGVLRNGFEWDVAHPAVNEAVEATVEKLRARGVETKPVTVEYHSDILSLLTPLEIQGGYRTMTEAGVGTHHSGWYWSDLIDSFDQFRSSRIDELPPTAKHSLLVGAYLSDTYGVEFYAKAKNVVLELRRQYDTCLETCDALVMPTVPTMPFEDDGSLDRTERVGRVTENHRNTAQFNHTHHPALTVPCGIVSDLPVGIQLVGSHFDERTLLRIGAAVERVADSPSVPVSV